MKKKLNLGKNKLRPGEVWEIDYQDFLKMNYEGLTENEIAQEIGISKEDVKKIKDQINLDY